VFGTEHGDLEDGRDFERTDPEPDNAFNSWRSVLDYARPDPSDDEPTYGDCEPDSDKEPDYGCGKTL
jgi:hypothetical protein